MKKDFIIKSLASILLLLTLIIGGQIIYHQNRKIDELYEQVERLKIMAMKNYEQCEQGMNYAQKQTTEDNRR